MVTPQEPPAAGMVTPQEPPAAGMVTPQQPPEQLVAFNFDDIPNVPVDQMELTLQYVMDVELPKTPQHLRQPAGDFTPTKVINKPGTDAVLEAGHCSPNLRACS
eukprot:9198905-Pyramimonas_sp.AAC.1